MGKRNQFVQRFARLTAMASIALSGNWSAGFAQTQLPEEKTLQAGKTLTITGQVPVSARTTRPFPTAQSQGAYILGPGDALIVELLDVPEYSGIFTLGPDGTLYIPRLRSVFAEGLTVEELQYSLTRQFSAYVHDPQVFVSLAAYRPIRVYVGGEVARPGYYDLSEQQVAGTEVSKFDSVNIDLPKSGGRGVITETGPRIGGVNINRGLRLPTVFDALRNAGGVTPFSKLSDVTVTRKRPLSNGGGKIRTTLNFLTLITEGNETQNIRLFDGDTIVVDAPLNCANRSSLARPTSAPTLFRSCDRSRPGSGIQGAAQGASLDRSPPPGARSFCGQVEFIRFNRDGSTDKRKFFVGCQPCRFLQKSHPYGR